jgi:Spy/CpxP family protein refolding chaperone
MRMLLIGVLSLCLFAPAAAQPERPTAKAKPGDAAEKPKLFLLDVTNARAKSGRVPNGYGQLGLTQQQRERIYGIQAAYSERIKELEAEIEALKAEQSEQIKNVLTDAQRQQIERYEEQARARRGGG